MKTLVYWVADILVDHPCYSIRAKTKQEVLDVLSNADPSIFGEPREVVVEYEDAVRLDATMPMRARIVGRGNPGG